MTVQNVRFIIRIFILFSGFSNFEFQISIGEYVFVVPFILRSLGVLLHFFFGTLWPNDFIRKRSFPLSIDIILRYREGTFLKKRKSHKNIPNEIKV